MNKDNSKKETIEIVRRRLDNKEDKHTVVIGENSARKRDVDDTEPL